MSRVAWGGSMRREQFEAEERHFEARLRMARAAERGINEQHCQQCGSTDYEDLYGPDADSGYTGCCNERTVGPGCDPSDCHHQKGAGR